MNEIELERTFLIQKMPEEVRRAMYGNADTAKRGDLPMTEGVEPVRIVDVYIPDGPEHSHLRLRQKGERYFITKKTPMQAGDASSQLEQTIELMRAEYEALAQCSEKRVVKDRYRVTLAGQPAEVDVFLDKLQGLVLVDFEFENTAAKDAFVPPKGFIEVTELEAIAGGMLAGRSYEEVKDELPEG